jgi:hypothetical protein
MVHCYNQKYRTRNFFSSTQKKLIRWGKATSDSQKIPCILLNPNVRYHVYVQTQLDVHGFVCILYFTLFALDVSGAVFTHHQEHKLQSTATGMRNLWKREGFF